MRTSGRGSDLSTLLVPLVLFVAVLIGFSGDGGQVFRTLEKQLWNMVDSVGRWVAAGFS